MMICGKCGHENPDGSNFCSQCGSRLGSPSDATSVIPIVEEDVPHAEISAEDTAAITVSRHHAKFTMQDGQMTITDLGSLNGTYVNRTLVDGSAVLRPGEEVQIGKFRMVFFVSEHGLH